MPYLLDQAGVDSCIGYSQTMTALKRNLPFQAGTAAAYGLDKEKAVSMITLNTARILGIDDQVGSLEVGKQATLFVSKGDALDMRGNGPTHIFIDGANVPLEGMQERLFNRYRARYGHGD